MTHMEWNGDKEEFERRMPRPSPLVKVKVHVLNDLQMRYGEAECEDARAAETKQLQTLAVRHLPLALICSK